MHNHEHRRQDHEQETAVVAELVRTTDPFWDLGFQPIGGGYLHLPPIPTLEDLRLREHQREWVRICARGLDYDLGRFAYFVCHPNLIRAVEIDGRGALVDGRHRLGAAWLLELPSITVVRKAE